MYDDLLQNMLKNCLMLRIKRPDLLVHIRISFPKMLERIKNVAVLMNKLRQIQRCMITIKC